MAETSNDFGPSGLDVKKLPNPIAGRCYEPESWKPTKQEALNGTLLLLLGLLAIVAFSDGLLIAWLVLHGR